MGSGSHRKPGAPKLPGSGRPKGSKKQDGEARTIRKGVRFTKEEFDLINAARGKTPLATWIVEAAVEKAFAKAYKSKAEKLQSFQT